MRKGRNPVAGRDEDGKPYYYSTKVHDTEGAVRKTARLSGKAYVSLSMKDTFEPPGKVLIMQPEYCRHGVTICTDCAESWGWDYDLHYQRTEGGRNLKEKLAA